MSAQVEARCPETLAYYQAYVKDYKEGKALVTYPNRWKPDAWVPVDWLRRPSPPVDILNFAPEPAQVLEAMAQSAPNEPSGWWQVGVKSVSGPYIVVTFVSFDDYTEVLEKSKLRPYNKNPPLQPSDFEVAEIAVPESLRAGGVHEHFDRFFETSGILTLVSDAARGCLRARGPAAALHKFSVLARMHLKHVSEQVALEQRVQQAAQTNQQIQQVMDQAKRVEFTLPEALVGLAIGKQGANRLKAAKLRDVLSVEVQSSGHVLIRARTEQACEAARKLLDFAEERVPVPRAQVGRLAGKGYAGFNEIAREAGVMRLRVEGDADSQRTQGQARNRQGQGQGARRGAGAGAGAGVGVGAGRSRWGDDDDTDTVDVVIVGLRDAIPLARLLLEEHLAFVQRMSELSQAERIELTRLKEAGRTVGAAAVRAATTAVAAGAPATAENKQGGRGRGRGRDNRAQVQAQGQLPQGQGQDRQRSKQADTRQGTTETKEAKENGAGVGTGGRQGRGRRRGPKLDVAAAGAEAKPQAQAQGQAQAQAGGESKSNHRQKKAPAAGAGAGGAGAGVPVAAASAAARPAAVVAAADVKTSAAGQAQARGQASSSAASAGSAAAVGSSAASGAGSDSGTGGDAGSAGAGRQRRQRQRHPKGDPAAAPASAASGESSTAGVQAQA